MNEFANNTSRSSRLSVWILILVAINTLLIVFFGVRDSVLLGSDTSSAAKPSQSEPTPPSHLPGMCYLTTMEEQCDGVAPLVDNCAPQYESVVTDLRYGTCDETNNSDIWISGRCECKAS